MHAFARKRDSSADSSALGCRFVAWSVRRSTHGQVDKSHRYTIRNDCRLVGNGRCFVLLGSCSGISRATRALSARADQRRSRELARCQLREQAHGEANIDLPDADLSSACVKIVSMSVRASRMRHGWPWRSELLQPESAASSCLAMRSLATCMPARPIRPIARILARSAREYVPESDAILKCSFCAALDTRYLSRKDDCALPLACVASSQSAHLQITRKSSALNAP